MNQPYICMYHLPLEVHMYHLPFGFLSHPDHHRALSRVPCATQYVLICYRFSVCNSGDPGSVSGLGRSPGERHGKSLQYSCLENPMDRGAWWATVHGAAKSQVRLRDLIHSSVHVLTPIPQFLPLLLSPLISIHLFPTCVTLFLLCM